MIPWRLALAAILLPAATAAGALVTSFDEIRNWTGTGPNRAALVIDWEDGKNLPGDTAGQSLAWGFRWNDGAAPTGLGMLKAVADADPRLQLRIVVRNFGGPAETVFGLYYDLDGDGGTPTFDPLQEYGSADDPDDHFAEGWLFNGYWAYFTGPAGENVPAWGFSGAGPKSRTVPNNGWDAWSFRTFEDPGTTATPDLAAAAIPEPTSALLLALGAVILWRRR